MTLLALKVDIDTRQGMEEGLPRILDALQKRNIPASFYISFGPDRSGLAVLQLLRPRFAWKMLRTKAAATYGLRTALYGTLIRAPLIGCAFPENIRQLRSLGHETACHAWDHRIWQDWLPFMGKKSIKKWLEAMVNAYREILGAEPEAFGAPGWCIDTRVLGMLKGYGLKYLSCTRAQAPFVFEENGMIELPSNLPCIEEQGATGVLEALEKAAGSSIPRVLPVHTEVEGGRCTADFDRILDRALSLGFSFVRVSDIALQVDRPALPVRPLKIGWIKNRAFRCAV
jgi:peptidoglycan/xylan/chitin deacetylase (PgdA/CDA1 family)